jgi:hypothetical protein
MMSTFDEARDASHDDLDALFEADSEDVDPADLVAANRMLRLLARFDGERAQVNRVADADVAVAERWRDGELAKLDRKVDYLRRQLENWMRGHALVSGARTEKLPWGELRLRPAKTRIDVDAKEFAERVTVPQVSTYDGVAVEWVRVKVEPDKQAMAAALTAKQSEDGVLLDAVDVGDDWLAVPAVDAYGEVYGGWVRVLVPREPDRFECVPRTLDVLDGEL